MSELGLCINANGMIPDPGELRLLGLGAGTWVRTPIQGSIDLLDHLMATIPDNIKVFVELNNECVEVGGNWSGWEKALRLLVAKPYASRIKAVGCGNELDIWYDRGDHSLTPSFAADLVRRASPILRAAGIKVVMTSVASGGWQSYLEKLVPLCRKDADWADLHLYVKSSGGINASNPDWQDAMAAMRRAREIAQMPTMCSEAGIKVDDAGGYAEQAIWVESVLRRSHEDLYTDAYPAVFLFAWSDGIGSSDEQGGQAFGLRGPEGLRKPSWWAFQQALGGPLADETPPIVPTPVPPVVIVPAPPVGRFQYDFLKWAQLEPELIGLPDETVEYGGIQGQSQQLTTTGLLTWSNLYRASRAPEEVLTFLRFKDKSRWLWKASWPISTRVSG